MPKLAPNQVPSYRRHKQSGQAIVTLSGRDILLGAHGTKASRAEYDRVTAEWIANGRRLPAAAASDLTVSSLIVKFWAHAERYYRNPDGTPGRELLNFKNALKPLRKLYGATPAAEFGPLALKAVRQSMIADLKWCRNVVNRQTTRVRQVFKWAVENELVPANVLHGLQAVAGLQRGRSDATESEPVKPVPEAHVYAIKDHVSAQVWAMVELQLLTGMRSDEVTAMRPIDLNTTGKNWVYSPPRHKNLHRGHRRDVHLGPQARRILEPFLAGRAFEAYIFSPADAEAERREKLTAARKTPLNCGNRPGTNKRSKPARQVGARYNATSYLRAVYCGCEKAWPPPAPLAKRNDETAAEWKQRLTPADRKALKAWQAEHRWHPHQLRHNAATRIAGTTGRMPRAPCWGRSAWTRRRFTRRSTRPRSIRSSAWWGSGRRTVGSSLLLRRSAKLAIPDLCQVRAMNDVGTTERLGREPARGDELLNPA